MGAEEQEQVLVRKNPPPSEFTSHHRKLVKGQKRVAKKVTRAKMTGQPKGCGKYGCAWPHARSKNLVTKVTADADEVKWVRRILDIRSGKTKQRTPTARGMALLKAVGVTPATGKRLPGIIDVRGPVKKVGKYWEYAREAVAPYHHSASWSAREALDDAILEFFYEDYGKVRFPPEAFIKAYLKAYPKMRHIVQTEVALRVLYGMGMGDVHDEQVGRARTARHGHPKGALVLYDGWLSKHW